MSAEIIQLALHRPVRKALDCVRVEADTSGQVVLIVVDGVGDEVEVMLAPHEAEQLRHQLADARDVAEAVGRG